ncbi:hypothetical protein [Chitinimonas naiadis]
MKTKPKSPRYQMENTLEGLRVTIPAERHSFIMLFLMVWVCGWLVGEVLVIGQLFNPKADSSYLFRLCWFVGWTLGGVMAICSLIWQCAGREIVTLNAAVLLHRVEAFGVGQDRAYPVVAVKDLRVFERPLSDEGHQSLFPPILGFSSGPIAFDYAGKTIWLASSLEVGDAKVLVSALAAKLPQRVFQS